MGRGGRFLGNVNGQRYQARGGTIDLLFFLFFFVCCVCGCLNYFNFCSVS